jgi:D-3-phosphoglycerate dehydrogenase / 2-oxoglutarate reductase
VRKVLVCSRSFGGVTPVGSGLLHEAGFEIRRVAPEERPLTVEKMLQIAAGTDPQVVICGTEPLTGEVLEACPNLAMVMKHGVGIDNIDLAAATRLKIAVANAPGTNTESVADLTVGLMLALLRRVCEAVGSTRAGGWERYVGRELGALTIGVVGSGRIGIAVIHRLKGFDSKVLAYDIAPNEALASQLGFSYASLDQLLEEADIVTLHLPLAGDTRGLIGRRELGLMKDTACLVNLARGELVDEPALCDSLRAGRIAGAAVDVYAVEPPQSSPLLTLENVLATPHIAAYTREAMERMDRACAETIIDTFHGMVHPNLLNPEVLTERIGASHEGE